MQIITLSFLRENRNCIFVYGDNTIRKGCAGAAKFRHEPNTYGFITKKLPSQKSEDFFKPQEYRRVFDQELSRLIQLIESSPGDLFLISKIGSGLANKYKIWENVIEPKIQVLKKHANVNFLWE